MLLALPMRTSGEVCPLVAALTAVLSANLHTKFHFGPVYAFLKRSRPPAFRCACTRMHVSAVHVRMVLAD